mmetsp:Transcript_60220/g.173752  ORF Transcript_60220/g.173752 Transcript_60220/m.173752 type:complete len:255 (-) Transcript_60220:460-1224(-)
MGRHELRGVLERHCVLGQRYREERLVLRSVVLRERDVPVGGRLVRDQHAEVQLCRMQRHLAGINHGRGADLLRRFEQHLRRSCELRLPHLCAGGVAAHGRLRSDLRGSRRGQRLGDLRRSGHRLLPALVLCERRLQSVRAVSDVPRRLHFVPDVREQPRPRYAHELPAQHRLPVHEQQHRRRPRSLPRDLRQGVRRARQGQVLRLVGAANRRRPLGHSGWRRGLVLRLMVLRRGGVPVEGRHGRVRLPILVPSL